MKRLSIIVPIFNVESYVNRCLQSLENQDIPKADFEIICVNDGSPDNSREVVIQMQREFDNIRLIDQENLGVSCARNNGIEKASGRYLLFIDPDDYVDNKVFSRVLSNAYQYDAQVSFLGFTVLNVDGSVRKKVFSESFASRVYSGIEAYFLARGDGETDPDRTWAVLFKTEFLDHYNLRYLSDVHYLEDGEFIARILCLAERCIFEGQSFYLRTTRPGSATNSRLFQSEKAANGFVLAAKSLKRFQQTYELNGRQKKFLNQPICKFVLLSLMSSMNSLPKFIIIKNKLKSVDLQKCDLAGCNKFYRLEGALYNMSPYLFLLHRKFGAPILKILRFFSPYKLITN